MERRRTYRKPSELHQLYQTDLDRHLYVFTIPGNQPAPAGKSKEDDGSNLLEWVQSGLTRWKAAGSAWLV
ncbi:MAG: hypothetical protein V3S83_11560 [Gemmatimonadota bacterium]